MKKVIAIISCLMLVTLALNAQTYYYKMCSFTQGGATYTNVSGGQFITFRGAMCMETDAKGKPCGNGTLQRTIQNKDLYIGSSFWGPKTKFVFSSDRSSLKVTAPDGAVYSYQRSNAPQGVTTSSLISGGNGGSGGVYVTTPVNSSGSGAASHSSSSSGSNYKKTEHPKKCQRCLGSGVCPKCGGKGTYNNMGAGGYTRCPSCGGTGKCTMCHGKGTYGSEWY